MNDMPDAKGSARSFIPSGTDDGAVGRKLRNVLFLSHTFRGGAFVVGSHHLSRQLARQGYRVAHISVPVSMVARLRGGVDEERLRQAKEGAHRAEGVVDLVPRTFLPLEVHWSRHWLRRQMQAVGMPTPDVVFVDAPKLLPGCAWLQQQGTTVILRPTDEYTADVNRQVRKLITQVDGVVATSKNVVDSIEGMPDSTPRRVFENGVDFERFYSGGADEERGDDVVYVGAVDERLDLPLLNEVAKARPDVTFRIYGPVSGRVRTSTEWAPNLHLEGRVSYEEVPQILRLSRVAVLPLVDTPMNHARSPMKLYEYLAAGLSVVAPEFLCQRHPAIESLAAYVPESMMSFMDALDACRDSSGPSKADISYVVEHDWEQISRGIMSFVGGVADR